MAPAGSTLNGRAPVAGKQMQVERKRCDQQDRQPEARQRDAERGDAGDEGIDARSDFGRRQDAERYADDCRDQERVGRNQDRVRHPLLDQVRDRRARQQRNAEVALHGVPEPGAVLDDQRTIEAEQLADLVDPLLGRVVAGQHQRRIAGHQMQQRKDHERRKDDDRHDLQQPPADQGVEAHHVTIAIMHDCASLPSARPR